jgi:acylphosphatase
MLKRAHVYFSGFVQGIFFRAFIRDEAKRLSLNGWVRNLEDGRVEAVFEGSEPTINTILEICQTEHPRARISKVEIKWEDPENLKGFKIIY